MGQSTWGRCSLNVIEGLYFFCKYIKADTEECNNCEPVEANGNKYEFIRTFEDVNLERDQIHKVIRNGLILQANIFKDAVCQEEKMIHIDCVTILQQTRFGRRNLPGCHNGSDKDDKDKCGPVENKDNKCNSSDENEDKRRDSDDKSDDSNDSYDR